MASIVGNYQLERNENLDEYFKAIGMENEKFYLTKNFE